MSKQYFRNFIFCDANLKLYSWPSRHKMYRRSRPEEFFVKGVLKICSIFTGEHACRSVISIKVLCNFIEITLWHGCSPVNLLHIFGTLFPKNASGWLLLDMNWKFRRGPHQMFFRFYTKLRLMNVSGWTGTKLSISI